MYEQFFGFCERPFELTPNPRFLLLTDTHREALNTLDYGIRARKGVTLLIGEAGSGKTTLIKKALELRREQANGHSRDLFVYISNPRLTRSQFFETLAERFSLGSEAASSKARFLRELEHRLRECRDAGTYTVLIVDEAQSVSDDVLEELRLLANVETDTEKLLQLVLTGQPELAERLNERGLRQLKQRIALRCRLASLTLEETASYIAGRIHLAGGNSSRIFTREAVIAVHVGADGLPRTINVICDNALLTAFAANEQRITSATVQQVCADLDLGGRGIAARASHTHGGHDAPQQPHVLGARRWSRNVIALFNSDAYESNRRSAT
jgi:type II secretory pathway predicted ATPase ExeA